MDTHICNTCKQDKPLSEYYVYPSGRRYTKCIDCQKVYTKKATRKGSNPHPHEIETLNYLQHHGIPTMGGKYVKHPDFNNIDLVAFGIVKVEAKLADENNTIWFSHKQRENFPSDVIIVQTIDGTYHVFNPDYHRFFDESGERKARVRLTRASLAVHLDYVELIHKALKIKMSELALSVSQD